MGQTIAIKLNTQHPADVGLTSESAMVKASTGKASNTQTPKRLPDWIVAPIVVLVILLWFPRTM